MAFAPVGQWTVGFSFVDNNDNVAVTSAYFPGDRLYADVQDDAIALANALQAVSDARLRTITILRDVRNDDNTPIPASSEVERKLSLTFGSADFPRSTRMEVPSPIFALEQPRTDAVDPNNVAFQAAVAAIIGTPVALGTAATDYRGVPLTLLSRAVIRHRSRSAND